MKTIVTINAGAFVGSTWISALLGTHPDVLSVGNPKKSARNIAAKGDDCCIIHRKECDFWPGFLVSYSDQDDFLKQLSEYSAHQYYVVDNPTAEEVSLWSNSNDLELLNIYIVRDLRAVTASYWRKNPETSFEEILHTNTKRHISAVDTNNLDGLLIKYEDAVADQLDLINRLGKFTQLKYDEKSLDFWNFDQHFLTGNGGTTGTIRMMNGQNLKLAEHNKYYLDIVEKLKGRGGNKDFNDVRWKSELTRHHLWLIDKHYGSTNESRGYSRDCFSETERSEFEELESR